MCPVENKWFNRLESNKINLIIRDYSLGWFKIKRKGKEKKKSQTIYRCKQTGQFWTF